MEMARFGKTGMKVSRLCLGCMTYGSTKWRDWVLDEEASRPFIREALERGINFFDTADMYSVGASEEVLGRALKEYAKRDEVVVATKVFNPMGPGPNARGLSRKHVMEAIDASLKRLGMDYVDLYQIHRFDYETPIEETVEALNDVVRAGKALYVGASSMWTWQFARMISVARERGLAEFVSMQNFYNLVYREEEREMMKFCADQGIAVIPWSPLARGYLAREGAAALGEGAATVRGRTDAYPRVARPRLAPGRSDPPPRRRSGRQIRRQAGGGRLGVGAVEALCHRADRRRLEAAPSRRRGRGAVAQARRARHRQARGALPPQGGGRASSEGRPHPAASRPPSPACGNAAGAGVRASGDAIPPARTPRPPRRECRAARR